MMKLKLRIAALAFLVTLFAAAPVWADAFKDWLAARATATADGGTMYYNDAGTSKKIVATKNNTADTIVKRDASGNFAAGTITASLTGTASGNAVANADNAFSAKQTIALADAGTNTVPTIAEIGHTSTGTAASGLGASLDFALENASGTKIVANQIQSVWATTPTAGAEDPDLVIMGRRDGGALTEYARFRSRQGNFFAGDFCLADPSTVGTPACFQVGNSAILNIDNAAGNAGITVGAQRFHVALQGAFGFSSTGTTSATNTADALWTRRGAASIQQGAADAASPVAQNYGFQGSRGGTDSNVAGTKSTITSSLGTGNAAGASVGLRRAIMQASGTTQHTAQDALTVCESKTLSNTTGTATAIANIALPNNSACAAYAKISVQCNDGTNFDADLLTSYDSFVNKAGTLTIGTAVTTGSSAANNSGSCTVAPTWVANGTTSIDLKVTPVITTIVPTTTTAFVTIETFCGTQTGVGVTTCQ